MPIVYHGTNVFKNYVNDKTILGIGRRGTWWTGPLLKLACSALATLSHELIRPIDDEKLRHLYAKSRYYGCIYRAGDDLMIVNKYRFCKWIARNWHRILLTRSGWNSLMDEMEDDADIDTMEKEGRGRVKLKRN